MFQYYNFAEMFKPEEVLDYLRKSRTDDPNLTVGEVLEKHEKILDDWVEKNLTAPIPQENRFYEIVSGETIKDRPEFKKVLKLIESPKYKAILVVEVQRLSRGDLEDAGRLIKLLRYTGTYVITPTKTYDIRDEYDREIFERELKRGNEYLEYSKKIMNRGKLLSVQQGNYIAAVAPYGFDKTTVMDGKKKCPTLKENPEQANVVRMIFDMYGNKGMGRTVICHNLDDLGIKPLKAKQWSPRSIAEILCNVHYIGKVRWNYRPEISVVENGEIKKKRPDNDIEKVLIYEGKHNGIVTQEIWDKVQNRLGNNPRYTAKVKLRNPFAGLLFCRQCGRAMLLQQNRDKNGKQRCAMRMCCSTQSRCGTGSCTFQDIVDRVCFILQQYIDDFEILVKGDSGETLEYHTRLIANLENKLKEIEAQELSQWKAQSHPDPAQRMPQEIFKKLNENLLKEKEETQQALKTALETMPKTIEYEEKLTRFKAALETLKDPEASGELKNELLKSCFERIEYYKERPVRLSYTDVPFPANKGNWSDPPIELDIKLKA